jgi:hypothetical protein
VHEAPSLQKEGGGVMNRILSESLSNLLTAATVTQYLAFLKSQSFKYRFMLRQQEKRGFQTTMKGGEKGTVIEQITEQTKFLVTLIRRMEVKI